MKMMLRVLCGVLCSAMAVSCQGGDAPEPKATDRPAAGDELLAEMRKLFKEQGIVVDAKQHTVTIPAAVNRQQDPIEYLLIHDKGKKHEAVFRTSALPSVLHAALLMIGLEPGKNATYTEKDPAPTLEEVRAGVDPLIVTPPKGKPYYMTVRWQDADGKQVEHAVEELLLDLSTQEPLAACEWVYLGGRMAQLYKGDPEVYIADLEGNLVSVCYLTPDNHLGTMVHERARDDQNWWTTTLLPEPGTDVEFVFHKLEPKVRVAWRERQRAKQDAAPVKSGGESERSGKSEAGGGR